MDLVEESASRVVDTRERASAVRHDRIDPAITPQSPLATGNPWARLVELAIVWICVPGTIALLIHNKVVDPRRIIFGVIWGMGLVAIVLLLTDRSFDRRQLWNWRGFTKVWKRMVIRLAVLGTGAAGVLAVFEPSRLLGLPRERPLLWVAVMVLYPIFSVYPQELAFRGMVHQRYRVVFERFLGPLGPGSVRIALVLTSAVVFSWAHVVMLNPWAIGFCLIGGLLFADTYERSRSLAAVSIEHALYGCWMFTAGWGYYFYAGGAAMAG